MMSAVKSIGFCKVAIRPDNILLSGLSGNRLDSEIHYPVHL